MSLATGASDDRVKLSAPRHPFVTAASPTRHRPTGWQSLPSRVDSWARGSTWRLRASTTRR